jgi:S-formylglutathione hydrolase FrmB
MGIDFPFDLETGEWRDEVWAQWKNWDPVRMVERYADNLRKLRLIYIDCGTKDEFNLQWGARMLHSKLSKLGIEHSYEEFDDGHMNITYRYDVSLPKLYQALKD